MLENTFLPIEYRQEDSINLAKEDCSLTKSVQDLNGPKRSVQDLNHWHYSV